MERKVCFYKLNKTKRYQAEGTHVRVGEAILLGIIASFFLAWGIALTVIYAEDLFREISETLFAFVPYLICVLIITFACVRFYPVLKDRRHTAKIIKNGILTDGTVREVFSRKIQRFGTEQTGNYSYEKITVRYEFYTPNGMKRQGEFRGSYAANPFYIEQNLMIAFDEHDSVILNSFTLLDGAETFAQAEEERTRPDFSGLTGNLINIDVTKPIELSEYSWSSLLKNNKRGQKLQRILKNNPSFTVGRFFIKKSTYRYKAGNTSFYCYIDSDGAEHIEACAGICGLKDGNEVIGRLRRRRIGNNTKLRA